MRLTEQGSGTIQGRDLVGVVEGADRPSRCFVCLFPSAVLFRRLTPDDQRGIADELDRTPADISKKLEEMASRII